MSGPSAMLQELGTTNPDAVSAATSPVYGSFDRAALDREYDAFPTAKGFDKDAQYRLHSRKTIGSLERIADIVYDERSGAKLDIYPAGHGSPVFIWFHGGYWRASSKDDNAFIADQLVPRGIAVANVDYSLAPAVTLDEIVRQVRTSIAWLHRSGPTFGIDPREMHIGGHSAGGQLIGMLLCEDWKPAFGVPCDSIGTALGISGLYDLEPVRHCYVNDWLALDAAAAHRNSPVHCVPPDSRTKLLLSVGGKETSEFRRQSTLYRDAWLAQGNLAAIIPMPQCHHFDIILALAQDGSPLLEELVASIRRP